MIPSIATAFLSLVPFGDPLLVDEAPERGADILGYGKGVAMVDLDGDGLMDLYVGDHVLQNTILKQEPDHTFCDVTVEWGGPFGNWSTWGVLSTDFDGDGDNDVFISNGGFIQPEANQLIRNDFGMGGVLVDVSENAGDVEQVNFSHGGTVLDYDRDGDLDIFVCNDVETPNSLLRNDGGLVFTDVAASSGITQPGGHLHATSGDYDNDGWFDIAVGNFATPGDGNRLYHNEGDGTFVDMAPALGVHAPDQNFGLVLTDFDNDGWMDLFVPKYKVQQEGSSILARNRGDGTFFNVTPWANLTAQTDMGHNTGDIDADGIPEIYVGTGNPHFADMDLFWRVETLEQGGQKIFRVEDAAEEFGISAKGPTRTHGTVFGDFDQDGDVDLYANLGGMGHAAEQMETNALWINTGNGNHWAALSLRGTLSPRAPVGTRSVAVTDSGREVHLYYSVGRGFANTDSPIQHFGLAQEDTLESIRITWPSGLTQLLLEPDIEVVHEVVETGLRLNGTPAPDTTVTLDICGAPGHTAAVYYSTQTFPFPLPQYGGYFYLVPPINLVTALVLDSDGVETLAATVPDDPNLSGATLWLQSFVLGPGTDDVVLSEVLEFAIQ